MLLSVWIRMTLKTEADAADHLADGKCITINMWSASPKKKRAYVMARIALLLALLLFLLDVSAGCPQIDYKEFVPAVSNGAMELPASILARVHQWMSTAHLNKSDILSIDLIHGVPNECVVQDGGLTEVAPACVMQNQAKNGFYLERRLASRRHSCVVLERGVPDRSAHHQWRSSQLRLRQCG